jgi:hypothetical protein
MNLFLTVIIYSLINNSFIDASSIRRFNRESSTSKSVIGATQVARVFLRVSARTLCNFHGLRVPLPAIIDDLIASHSTGNNRVTDVTLYLCCR